jgi:hypothetical protein
MVEPAASGTPSPAPAAAAPASLSPRRLEAARQRLDAARGEGTLGSLLRGVHLGLVGHRGDAPHTAQLLRAAHGLGARTSLLAERDLLAREQPGAREAARLLGRLYEGLDCDCGDAAAQAWLAAESGLPVTSLVTAGSAGAQALERFAGSSPWAAAEGTERAQAVLQVGLLAGFGQRRG